MMASNVIPFPNETQSGATPDEWAHLDIVLGLTADLLPVVSNRDAVISPNSSLKEKGKVPSVYNAQHHVVGLPNWTQKQSTPQEVYNWSQHPDYGICIQTRHVRAIDVDVADAAQAAKLSAALQHLNLPMRYRSNSGKFLLIFQLDGAHAKRKMVVDGGIIEFLANGQQFVAVGTHPSGVPYQWRGGLPNDIPALTPDQFNTLWKTLTDSFAVAPPAEGKLSERKKDQRLNLTDDLADYLYANELAIDERPDGSVIIQCPWESEHTTGEAGDTSTLYFPAGTNGYERGHFKCLHGHCEGRTDADFIQAIGYGINDFDVIPEPVAETQRFKVLSVAEFLQRPQLAWIIKDILPQAGLCTVFGDSGSGKTFFVLDMVGAIARGIPWRGLKTKQHSVVYICAEGAAGFRNRIQAYAEFNGVDPAQLPIGVIPASPNFMKSDQVKELLSCIQEFGQPGVIVVDTLAQVIPGANENSGEHMGVALNHCKRLHEATGAVIILVTHTGKDSDKGVRGWSGQRGAADSQIEILRNNDERAFVTDKLKDSGGEKKEYLFKLSVVKIGQDEDGDDISSCVITHSDASREPQKAEPRGAIQKLVLQVLQQITDLSDESIKHAHLIDAVIAQMLTPEGRDNRRRDVIRAIESLQSVNRLAIVDEFVRLV